MLNRGSGCRMLCGARTGGAERIFVGSTLAVAFVSQPVKAVAVRGGHVDEVVQRKDASATKVGARVGPCVRARQGRLSLVHGQRSVHVVAVLQGAQPSSGHAAAELVQLTGIEAASRVAGQRHPTHFPSTGSHAVRGGAESMRRADCKRTHPGSPHRSSGRRAAASRAHPGSSPPRAAQGRSARRRHGCWPDIGQLY